MNRSSRSPGSSRPSNKPSMNRPSGGGSSRIGGSVNKPGRTSSPGIFSRSSTGMNSNLDNNDLSSQGINSGGQPFLGGNQGSMNQPYDQGIAPRPRRRFGAPLIVGLVIGACCLILLCILGVYLLLNPGVIGLSGI